MKRLRDGALSVIIGLVTVIALLYLSYAEQSRRAAVDATLADMHKFMATGPRFPLQYGMSLCEHLRQTEIATQSKNPIDCDAMRHAITQAGK